MFVKTSFYRVIAMPACIAWGLVELVALQRARWQLRRNHVTRSPQ